MRKIALTLVAVMLFSIMPESEVQAWNSYTVELISFNSHSPHIVNKIKKRKLKKTVRKVARVYRKIKSDRDSRKSSRKVQRKVQSIINIF